MSSKPHKTLEIGKWTSTSLVLGNMIGSGIFLLPASLAAFGSISLVGWIISSLGALALAKVFANLGSNFPKVGGPYAYTRLGFGDFPAFLVAWGYWISCCCTNAAITVAMLSYLTIFFPILKEATVLSVFIGLSTIWLLTWINSRGIKEAGWIQLITTILKVTPLILIAICGVLFLNLDNFSQWNISGASSFTAIIETTTLTLFAYLGIECATIPADKVSNPKGNIPKATMLGTYIAIAVYILGTIAVFGIIPPEELQNSNAPFADAALIMWGPLASKLVAAGAVISTFGALNGWILMQGQIPLAAAKDNLFPAFFGKLNLMGSPTTGIIFSSILVSILMCMNFAKGFIKAFEFMILLSTLTVLVPYLFSTGTHLMIHLNTKKKTQLLIGSLAFLFSLYAVIGSGSEVVFWGFIFLMIGIPVYVWIKRKNKIIEK